MKKPLSEALARAIHEDDYVGHGLSLSQCSEKRGISWYQISSAFRRYSLARRRPCCGRKRIAAEIVQRMHADYMLPMSLAAVGRKYKRDRRCVRELFERRGLFVRPCELKNPRDPKTGRILPYVPKTAAELTEIVARAKKIKIPDELRLEWRHWSLKKRAAFIVRIRIKLKSPKDRPNKPFSSNVTPFDYATPAARAIAAKTNRGLGSREAVVKIDLSSQGVIYQGKLWFWNAGTGYQIGPWTPENGRPSLHHTIWEKHHGREVPSGYLVSSGDGNPNNLDPSNLVLLSMEQNLRRNQSAALFRKSRERTALLLERTQQGKEQHGHIETIQHIKERSDRSRIPTRKAA